MDFDRSTNCFKVLWNHGFRPIYKVLASYFYYIMKYSQAKYFIYDSDSAAFSGPILERKPI